VRVNLGSGVHPAAAPWLNLDSVVRAQIDVVADCGRLPFADRSVDRLYAGHLLEHIPLAAVGTVLAEWRRVLRPGGDLMVVGPDIDRAVRQREPWWLLDSIIAHGEGPGGHAWTSSQGVLLDVLARCGWDAEPVEVAAVTMPEWPNPVPQAAWQLAVLAR
jgi:predicted SAM-dependent methyltransferase